MFQKNRWFWIIAVIGLAIDQATKYWTIKSFDTVGDTLAILPGIFHFTYVKNTGAAFSAFRGGVGWLRWLSLAVSFGLMALAWFGPRLSSIEQLAYGFILAGALGNGIDRFLFGFVVDFLDFRIINFPVFNIADVCINIGIFLLLISTFPRKSSRSRGESEKDR